MAKLVIFFFLLPSLWINSAHKFYVSMKKVEFVPKSKTVQITMRIFIDDLQLAVNNEFNKQIELAVTDESDDYNYLINKYLNKRFKLIINGKEQPLNFLGKEYDYDLAILFIEVENINSIESIAIDDTMLMKEFPTQKNIIKLKINNIKKTFFLTEDKHKDVLNF
ncbi:MAG: hypothetical protein CSA39_02055 [Flavobacteriales bacterium]|nr:MAG: hypothetical protein CR985_02910 [Flavobacteriales bacterium]PIE49564.1 MAG: hypothetical protein CSA39_02055 [Flavobacteriales bacterium]